MQEALAKYAAFGPLAHELRLARLFVRGYNAGMPKKTRKPTYEDLCDLLLYLDSDKDDGRPVAYEALGLLIQAGAISWQGKKHFDLTERGKQISKRLRNDNAAQELREVLE